MCKSIKQSSNIAANPTHSPLASQEQCQPYGVSVEQSGQYFVHDVEQVTIARRVYALLVAAQRVDVDVPGCGQKQCQQIGHGHCQQDHVGGRSHMRLPEDNHYEQIGDQCEYKQHGQNVAEQCYAQVVGQITIHVQ